MVEPVGAVHCLALVETTIFHESDEVFHEHIAWDIVGPLLVGVGIGVISYGIRRFFEWLAVRRRRRREEAETLVIVRRALVWLLKEQAAHGDREAKELLDELRKG